MLQSSMIAPGDICKESHLAFILDVSSSRNQNLVPPSHLTPQMLNVVESGSHLQPLSFWKPQMEPGDPKLESKKGVVSLTTRYNKAWHHSTVSCSWHYCATCLPMRPYFVQILHCTTQQQACRWHHTMTSFPTGIQQCVLTQTQSSNNFRVARQEFSDFANLIKTGLLKDRQN